MITYVASLGIAASDDADGPGVASLLQSLKVLAKHRSELGRIPLKVDPIADCAVFENSAGVDAGLWFAIAVFVASELCGMDAVAELVKPAQAGVHWVAHLDVDGTELICSPEASDWADMMPHRHHVLNVNVVYVLALRALAKLVDSEAAHGYRARATRIAERINSLLWLGDVTDPAAAAARIASLGAQSPEWGLTGQYATRYGSMPFYLSYSAFRHVGRHFDTVGNMLAILAGVADPAQSASILDYAHAAGVHLPAPSRTLDPPIYPGDPDWRDWFHWRNLCVPHHYQNGGAWPFAGALHAAAQVKAGRMDRARELYAGLERVCSRPEAPFPEWVHGMTGVSMGEVNQLWSATGLLFVDAAIRDQRVPILEALAS